MANKEDTDKVASQVEIFAMQSGDERVKRFADLQVERQRDEFLASNINRDELLNRLTYILTGLQRKTLPPKDFQ